MPKGRDREEGEPLIAAGDGDRASDEDEDWPAEDGVGAAATTTAASSASAEAGFGQAYEPAAHAAATEAPEAEDADDLDDLDDSAAARHPLLPAAASASSSSHRLVLGRSNNPSPLPDSASAPRSPGWGGGANSNYSSNAAHRGLPLELLELEDRSAANNNSSSSSNDPAGSGFDVLTMPSGRVVEVHHQGGAPAPGGAEVPVLGFISQVTPTLVVSGLGMIAAGVLLDVVQHWPLFMEISELFILVPALLGLKGNLEMTFSSRLSTSASLGDLNNSVTRRATIKANLAVMQVQAILVGFAAALFSVVMGVVVHHEFSILHTMLLLGASMATASIASGLLGATMSLIVVCSGRCNIDPDNIATPMAACLGDLVTLAILAGVGQVLYLAMHSQVWLSPLVVLLMLVVVLPLAYRAVRPHPREFAILTTKWAWLSIVLAMVVSSMAGLVLERFVQTYEGMAVLSPIINGVGGNLGAILASRICTSLHTGRRDKHFRAALILFSLVIPISLLFLMLVNLMHVGHTSMTPPFLTFYCLAAMVQVAPLLYISKKLVKYIWNQRLDPDNIAIPFVTAFGDLLGTAALTACFVIMWHLGDQDSDVGE